MARVVESVLVDFDKNVSVEMIVTKTMEGALRYQDLVRSLGKLLPIPSIIINGELAFETTPGVEVLKAHLTARINHQKPDVEGE